MDDGVDALEGRQDVFAARHVAEHEFGLWMQVGGLAGRVDGLLEAVEDPDVVPPIDQRVGRVRPDEAGSSRDQNAHIRTQDSTSHTRP